MHSLREQQRERAVQRNPISPGTIVKPVYQSNGMPVVPRGLTVNLQISNVAVQWLPIDFSRKLLFIQNNDPLGIVWLAIGAPASIGFGIKLAAGGGGIFLDMNCPTAQVNAIGTIALNPNIMILTA